MQNLIYRKFVSRIRNKVSKNQIDTQNDMEYLNKNFKSNEMPQNITLAGVEKPPSLRNE